jgi:hypothetical protein
VHAFTNTTYTYSIDERAKRLEEEAAERTRIEEENAAAEAKAEE